MEGIHFHNFLPHIVIGNELSLSTMDILFLLNHCSISSLAGNHRFVGAILTITTSLQAFHDAFLRFNPELVGNIPKKGTIAFAIRLVIGRPPIRQRVLILPNAQPAIPFCLG